MDFNLVEAHKLLDPTGLTDFALAFQILKTYVEAEGWKPGDEARPLIPQQYAGPAGKGRSQALGRAFFATCGFPEYDINRGRHDTETAVVARGLDAKLRGYVNHRELHVNE